MPTFDFYLCHLCASVDEKIQLFSVWASARISVFGIRGLYGKRCEGEPFNFCHRGHRDLRGEAFKKIKDFLSTDVTDCTDKILIRDCFYQDIRTFFKFNLVSFYFKPALEFSVSSVSSCGRDDVRFSLCPRDLGGKCQNLSVWI
jgi:hypothetical protein